MLTNAELHERVTHLNASYVVVNEKLDIITKDNKEKRLLIQDILQKLNLLLTKNENPGSFSTHQECVETPVTNEANSITLQGHKFLERKEKIGVISEAETLQKEPDALILSKKNEKWVEHLDDVKTLNPMVLNASKSFKETKEEAKQIQLYSYNKDLKDQAQLQELERVNQMKEMQLVKLRAMQEKAQDRQAQLHDLKAQKAQEASEQEWRENQKMEAEKLRKHNKVMERVREEQRLYKKRQLSRQAQSDHIEFLRYMRDQEAVAIASLKVEEGFVIRLNTMTRFLNQTTPLVIPEDPQQILDQHSKARRHPFLHQGIITQQVQELLPMDLIHYNQKQVTWDATDIWHKWPDLCYEDVAHSSGRGGML